MTENHGLEQHEGVTRDQVLECVRRLVAEAEGLDLAAVTPESDLERDLGMDSLSQVELQMALEEAFGVDLSPEVGASIRTVLGAAEAVLVALERR